MGLVVRRLSISIPDKSIGEQIVAALRAEGYNPVIAKAKESYRATLAEYGLLAEMEVSEESQQRAMQMALFDPSLVFGENGKLPVMGDIIFGEERDGFLYFFIAMNPEESARRAKARRGSGVILEAGYIGDEGGAPLLDRFAEVIGKAIYNEETKASWDPIDFTSKQFSELNESGETTFMEASAVTAEDITLARILENTEVRQLAIKIRRGGGLLASDLGKKVNMSEEGPDILGQLVEALLLSTEYVIICKQNSNQINRVRTREAIDRMAEVGVLCSCGRSVADERIEELFVPTDDLHRMLNQSFWTTARLVQALRKVGVPDHKVLLNLRDGADEIDAFIDVDGTLIIVELKDNEFSMGHAYPFGGRIAQYKPTYAMIVATRGVAPEVKDYFKRVKPEAEIIYVGGLEELEGTLSETVTRIRSKQAYEVLSTIENTATVRTPLSKSLASKLHLHPPDKRPARPYYAF